MWRIEEYLNIPDFKYYILADGIREILAKTHTGIASFLKIYYKNDDYKRN